MKDKYKKAYEAYVNTQKKINSLKVKLRTLGRKADKEYILILKLYQKLIK